VSTQLPTAKTADSLASDPALALARLAEADALGLDGKAEQSAELRAEGFASKLSQLSQAISQQTAQAGKMPLVPGQPLAMNQPGWSEAAVDRVMWLSSQNLKSAEIQLDPANLGRMEVRIQMTQEQTQVTFSSPHAHVREALESQAHRLRELFTQQGMNLLDVNVSDQSLARGWQGQGGEGERRGQRSSDDSLLGDADIQHGVIDISRSAAKSGRGLVDYYA
jgi:flagellar hook-length control protein FliK